MKIAVKLYKHCTVLLIISVLITIAYFMRAIPECLVMMACFLLIRRRYRFSYHCKSAMQCFLLSVTIFVIGMRLTLPVGVSYACCGICGLVLAHFFQHKARLDFVQRNYEHIKPKYMNLVEEKRQQDIYSMNEQSLREFCHSQLLDSIDEEIVVQRLIFGRKGKDLYDKIGYSKPQMIRREKRIEAKLNIKLKER